MVILEFTGDRVKLLKTAKKNHGLGIGKLLNRTMDGRSDDSISAVANEILHEAGIKKGSALTVCIPRHLVTVRILRLPSVDDAELKSMADLQAAKQLPYPTEELIWDFKVIEKRPDGYSDIFLAIAHKNVIGRYINILTGAGIDIERIVLSSEAILGWDLAVSAPGGIGAVLDVDTSYIDLIIIRGGRLEFSRSFPARQDLQEMAEEARKTFVSYQKENSREVSSVVFTGIEEKALALKALMGGILPSVKADFIHPLKILSMDYKESLSDYFDAARDISTAAVLGMAYNPQQVTMDFIPEDIKRDNRNKRRRKIFVKTLILAGAILFAFGAIMLRGAAYEKEKIRILDLKIKETEPKVARLKEISQSLAVIKEYLNSEGSCVDIMREVYKIIPQGVSISVLDFELDRVLTLRGVASELSGVFRFSSDLEKSGYFEKCQIKYAQKRTIKTQELVDFEINCALTSPVKK